MSNVDVKKQSSKQEPGSERSELQRQSGSVPGHRGGRDPFAFSSAPFDFFSTNPFTLMRRMSEEMDRTFRQVWGSRSEGISNWYPAIDVTEREGQLQVHAELPGLKPEDVTVEINNDNLIIRGERKYEREHQIGRAYRSERQYGQFYREIALPEGTNTDQTKANFRDGILEISIPVPQQASTTRQIPISTGGAAGTQTSAAAAGSQGTGGPTTKQS